MSQKKKKWKKKTFRENRTVEALSSCACTFNTAWKGNTQVDITSLTWLTNFVTITKQLSLPNAVIIADHYTLLYCPLVKRRGATSLSPLFVSPRNSFVLRPLFWQTPTWKVAAGSRTNACTVLRHRPTGSSYIVMGNRENFSVTGTLMHMREVT